MARLAQIPNIAGVKESSGDLAQIGDIIRDVKRPAAAAGRSFAVISGDDALTLPVLALGGDGVISVVSNLIPARVAALVKAGLDGNFAEARDIHYALLPFMKAAFVETNPVPIKRAMELCGLPSGPVRLPLGRLSQASESVLSAALQTLGVETLGVETLGNITIGKP
jgi:4-hydroxy-tetrahydrodipicolinate synthase